MDPNQHYLKKEMKSECIQINVECKERSLLACISLNENCTSRKTIGKSLIFGLDFSFYCFLSTLSISKIYLEDNESYIL